MNAETCPIAVACSVCGTPAPTCTGGEGCRGLGDGPCVPDCPGTPADPNTLTVTVVGEPGQPMSFCITRCRVCELQRRWPRLTVGAIVGLAREHADHVLEPVR